MAGDAARVLVDAAGPGRSRAPAHRVPRYTCEFSGTHHALRGVSGSFRISTWCDRADWVVQDGPSYSGTPLPERIDGRRNLYPEGTVQLPLPLASPGGGSCRPNERGEIRSSDG